MFDGICALRIVEVAPGLRDEEASDGLLGAAGGDTEEVQAIATDPPATLGQIQRNRRSRGTKLLGERSVMLLNRGQDMTQEANDLQRERESLEA